MSVLVPIEWASAYCYRCARAVGTGAALPQEHHHGTAGAESRDNLLDPLLHVNTYHVLETAAEQLLPS